MSISRPRQPENNVDITVDSQHNAKIIMVAKKKGAVFGLLKNCTVWFLWISTSVGCCLYTNICKMEVETYPDNVQVVDISIVLAEYNADMLPKRILS